MEGHIFKTIVAANDQVVGHWRGEQLGAISFPYEAATTNSVIFECNSIHHQDWGLSREGSTQRIVQAITDVRSFFPSSHLLACKLGDWQVKMVGARTATSLGWILNYLFTFMEKFPAECEHRLDLPPGPCEEEPSHGSKRQRELPEKEKQRKAKLLK